MHSTTAKRPPPVSDCRAVITKILSSDGHCFLQKFTVSENSICMLFANDARRQLHYIFIQFGDNIQTARQLRSAVFAKFFDKS